MSPAAHYDRNVSSTLRITKDWSTPRNQRNWSIVVNFLPVYFQHTRPSSPMRFLLLSCPRGGFFPLPISLCKDHRVAVTETDHPVGRLLTSAQPGAGHMQPDTLQPTIRVSPFPLSLKKEFWFWFGFILSCMYNDYTRCSDRNDCYSDLFLSSIGSNPECN